MCVFVCVCVCRRPVGEPQEGNRQLWNNTLGSDKFYAYLEALMDFRGDPIVREELGSSYQVCICCFFSSIIIVFVNF